MSKKDGETDTNRTQTCAEITENNRAAQLKLTVFIFTTAH